MSQSKPPSACQPRPGPELLAPCGSLHMLRTAVDFGADAVYAGQPRYSLRVRNNDFGKLEHLAEAIAWTHQSGKKFYLVSNLLPHERKVATYLADMAEVVALGPDALIMADPGLIMLARENWPALPIHLSVQANTLNSAAVRFWQKLGIRRVILSRELSLPEIAQIRTQCPEMELEVFVHGALCIAYSGRCLLSGYFNHRDANQGACTNACRWDYRVASATVDHGGEVVLLEESERPGQFLPLEQDEHGSYILNSKDLRAIEHVQSLCALGVNSLKIEGRTKSAYYVARTCQSYRQAIDDARAGKPFDQNLLAQLEGLAHRGYTAGFYQRHPDATQQNYLRGSSESQRSRFVGEVRGYASPGWARVVVKNGFDLGDRLEVIHPRGNHELVLNQLTNLEGAPLTRAPGSGHEVLIPLAPELDRAFLARFL